MYTVRGQDFLSATVIVGGGFLEKNMLKDKMYRTRECWEPFHPDNTINVKNFRQLGLLQSASNIPCK